MTDAPRTPSALQIAPVDRPVQTDAPEFGVKLVEVDLLVRAAEARSTFNVDGEGVIAAVLDTGLRSTHVDFEDRVIRAVNFTSDNGGKEFDASDGHGHGTNVAGIIAANQLHVGIAPKGQLIAMKVLSNRGGGNFEAIAKALDWIIRHHDEYPVSALCMSLGDGRNLITDEPFAQDPLAARIRELREGRVAVVVAAGNHYFSHGSRQGMAYPAILRETISVGAVYDADEGPFSYGDGARARSSAPDRLAPFSQRLHESVARDVGTDIFAPGAPVTSSGINNDHGESTQQGTSQATPVTVGVILLLQQLYKRARGELPKIDDLTSWLQRGAVVIHDGDDEADNVGHTNAAFRRISAPGALQAVYHHLQVERLQSGSA